MAAIDSGKVNALTRDDIARLRTTVAELGEAEALVITGRAGVFSAGLDLAVLGRGGPDADALLAEMGQLLLSVIECPRPVVVAADGHGVAAGAMLMLAADIAVVSDRDARFGFSEVANALPLPPAVIELITARVHPAAVMSLAAHARLVGPADAVEIGLADEIAPAAEVLDRAIMRAGQLAGLPADAYATTKGQLAAPLAASMRELMSR